MKEPCLYGGGLKRLILTCLCGGEGDSWQIQYETLPFKSSVQNESDNYMFFWCYVVAILI